MLFILETFCVKVYSLHFRYDVYELLEGAGEARLSKGVRDSLALLIGVRQEEQAKQWWLCDSKAGVCLNTTNYVGEDRSQVVPAAKSVLLSDPIT